MNNIRPCTPTPSPTSPTLEEVLRAADGRMNRTSTAGISALRDTAYPASPAAPTENTPRFNEGFRTPSPHPIPHVFVPITPPSAPTSVKTTPQKVGTVATRPPSPLVIPVRDGRHVVIALPAPPPSPNEPFIEPSEFSPTRRRRATPMPRYVPPAPRLDPQRNPPPIAPLDLDGFGIQTSPLRYPQPNPRRTIGPVILPPSLAELELSTHSDRGSSLRTPSDSDSDWEF